MTLEFEIREHLADQALREYEASERARFNRKYVDSLKHKTRSETYSEILRYVVEQYTRMREQR